MRYLLLSLFLGCDPDPKTDPQEDTAARIVDADGDGSAEGDDCDDAAAGVHPGAAEVAADGIDQDCDGLDLCYVDVDDDGYGQAETVAAEACDAAGVADNAADCDDTDSDVHPAAEEPCDEDVDYNCDGATQHADGDADGWAACEECDDADAASYPGAAEVTADGVDQDCDGNDTCYVDSDEDGHGGAASVVAEGLACDAEGQSENADDCDDDDAGVYPGAAEVVGDEIDQSCDGAELCYEDSDGDGYGDLAAVESADADCADGGESVLATDCDESQAATHPGAAEVVADGIDQSCDGNDTCYLDADEDGYGSTATKTGAGLICDVPASNLADDSTDCDDADGARYPGADEIAGDEVDQSCDGAESCWQDGDGDGYGVPTEVAGSDADCADSGESTRDDDCDDGDPALSPGATDAALDGIDQDCDGYDACYLDADGDGFGGASTITSGGSESCDMPSSNLADDADDCDDGDGASYPGAAETTGDEVDQSCDGAEICYLDADGDGFGGVAEVASSDGDCADAGESSNAEDCLDEGDGAADTWPGAAALELTGGCMTDADGDGYGSDAPAAGVDAGLDCDDADSAVTCVSSGSLHVGNDVEYPAASSHSPNYLLGSELVVSTPMTVTHLALISKSAGSNVKMALYTDSGGNPDALVVATAGTPVTVGVMEIPVTSTYIAAGSYWIMGIFDVSASIGIDYSVASVEVKYRSLSYSSAIPDPFGAVTVYTGQQFNYYLVGY